MKISNNNTDKIKIKVQELHAIIDELQYESRKIEYSFAFDRLVKRIDKLEERITNLEEKI